ncbi:DUF397 domain-containing protein [Kitasatospora sp. NPDC054795]
MNRSHLGSCVDGCGTRPTVQRGEVPWTLPGPAASSADDSKDPRGPALVFPAEAWVSFVAAVRVGEFGDI